MIASLRGTLISKSVTEIVVDVNGVGYAVSIPLSTYEKLGNENSTVQLLIYTHVREDVLQLYGFATEEERNLFKLLISVSGIGLTLTISAIMSAAVSPENAVLPLIIS